MDIWVRIHVNEDILGDLDNPDMPGMSEMRDILDYRDNYDILEFYPNSAIRVEGVES
jgi:hypothetical protein